MTEFQCRACLHFHGLKTSTVVITSKRGHNNWLMTCEKGHPWTPGIYDEVRIKIKLKAPDA